MSQDGDHGRSLEYEYHVGVFAARKEKKVTSKKRYKYTRGQNGGVQVGMSIGIYSYAILVTRIDV